MCQLFEALRLVGYTLAGSCKIKFKTPIKHPRTIMYNWKCWKTVYLAPGLFITVKNFYCFKVLVRWQLNCYLSSWSVWLSPMQAVKSEAQWRCKRRCCSILTFNSWTRISAFMCCDRWVFHLTAKELKCSVVPNIDIKCKKPFLKELCQCCVDLELVYKSII